KKNRERRQKEAAAQIRQLIETNLIQMDTGDTPYNFSDNNKIKKIYLPAEYVEKLGKGTIAIVRQAGEYQLVPSDVALKIEQLNRKQVIVFHKSKEKNSTTDDPYAEFEVPDDLMW
ncbi:MAG: DUF2058 domain-containing protein, partial [Bacteroidetes bacterium]|nr:DUF2058 domain-containing protein [Bacteroidota bacterium]